MEGYHSVKECRELTIQRIGYLIAGYIIGQLSTQEFRELEDWVSASIQNQLLFAELLLPHNIRFALARKN